MTETIEYFISPSGTYVGRLVNSNVVAQGHDLSELKKRLRILMGLHIDGLAEMYRSEFEEKEIKQEDFKV